MNRRVVITGLGLCTPAGRSVDECWQNLLAGRSGVGPITLFDAHALPVRIGGEVKNFETARLAEAFPGAAGEKDRKIWLGLDAASQAIRDAGRIVAFRNRLAHGYATVSNEVVWGIVETNLPALRQDVQALLPPG